MWGLRAPFDVMASLSMEGLSMTTHWLDFLPDSPLHRPTWRWQLANWMVATGRDVPHSYREGWVDRVRTSLTTPRRCTSYAAIREATHLFLGCGAVPKAALEAYLLTGEPVEVVSQSCSVPVPVVEAYVKVFFDVRDRLTVGDWIARMAIGSGLWGGFEKHDVGSLWKAFGYHGRSHVLDVIISVSVQDGLVTDIGALRDRLQPVTNARLMQSARMAIAAAMVPLHASGTKLSQLHAQVREVQATPKTRSVASILADSVMRSLTTSDRVEPPFYKPLIAAVG